jgi:hypothetical protein
MSDLDLLALMTGIESRLLTISGLRVTDYIPGQVNPPAAVIGVPAIESYATGLSRYQRPILMPTVTVLTSAVLDRVGQRALAEYASPAGDKSVPAAIAGDRTLGGVVDDCQVVRFDPLGIEEVGLIGYFGGRFTLRIVT